MTATRLNNALPVGTVIDFAGSTVPAGYLECNGQEVLKANYPLLYAAIGDSWGISPPWAAPTDSLHFRVPNLNGRVTIGSSTAHQFASGGGEETHTLTVDEMPSHTHRGMYSSGNGTNAGMAGVNTNNWYADGYNEATGGGQAHNNMQPFATLNKIIRAL